MTMLLVVAIMFILVTTMLTVAGNESVISGLHRDSVRAKEIAEGGLSEGLKRIELGHYYASNPASECYDTDPSNDQFFANSLTLDGSDQIRVCLQEAGVGAAIIEIQSNATVGVARRRLSLIAMQRPLDLLPNIVYGHDCSAGGSAEIRTGDIYCQTYVKHKTDESAQQLTYGGWFIKKNPGSAFGPCYRRDEIPPGETETCETRYPNWWPGHRRAMYESVAVNAQLEQGDDTRKLNSVFNFSCPSTLADDTPLYLIPSLATHERADDTVSSSPDLPVGMYQSTDKKQDNTAMPDVERLYGCTKDGFSYTWVREEFDSDDPDDTADVFMWFKTIEFEAWKEAYWMTCRGPNNPPVPECASVSGPALVKRSILANPSGHWRGAVPPFPDFLSLVGGAQQTVTGGGTLTGADPVNWGACVEGSDGVANNCDGAASEPRTILLTGGDYRINANIEAHGTILVGPNQDLEINGTFTCWCVLIVDGQLTLGNGTVTIYGGLVAKNTAELSGNITVYAGGSVPSAPVGLSNVEAISWWQR